VASITNLETIYMHRSIARTIAVLVLVAGCGDDKTPSAPFVYTLETTTPTLSIAQDSTKPVAITVKRSDTDTTIKNVQLEYRSADYSIATVDAAGVVTAVRGGTTTITALMGGTSIDVPVTVVPRPATFIELTILTGPAGGLKSVNADTGTFYALPADPVSSRLKAVVRVGASDTVFCNFCPLKTPARTMRQVIFRSLDPTRATISGFANLTQAATDTSGRITPLDTAAGGVKFVLEVPADNIADTVTVRFLLRPIDSLGMRPDSAFFPTANGTGLSKAIYPNSDNTQGNVKAASVINFTVGINYLSRVQDAPAPATPGTPGAVRFIPSRLFGPPTVFRKSVPSVVWQSANTDYLDINAAGAVTGKCAAIGGNCNAVGSSVLSCTSTGSAMPQAFAGVGTYSIPSCNPPRVITMPGAFCTTNSTTDLFSTCTVWVRATAIDQVTGNTLRSLYRINIGR
jgi:hypothetical protein